MTVKPIAAAMMNPDSEAVYDGQIAPLMARIIAICHENRIPMLATFQYGLRDDDSVDLCTTRIPFDGETPSLAQAFDVLYRQPELVAFAITTEKA